MRSTPDPLKVARNRKINDKCCRLEKSNVVPRCLLMRIMFKKFISINRGITNKFVNQCSSLFGDIDGAEKEFYDALYSHSWSRVIKIGGANRPLFNKNKLNKYIGIDIDGGFLWEPIYSEYFIQSCEVPLPKKISADLIVSKYVLEHTLDNNKVFKNINCMLGDGGVSIHIFPLGFHPFSIVNRLVGNRAAKMLIPIIRPGSESVTGYPAYYHMCNSVSLERYLFNNGFKYSVKYFFGAEDYFGFFAPFGCLIHIINRIAKILRMNILASNAVLIIKK